MSIPISLLLNAPMDSETTSSSQVEGGNLGGRSYKRQRDETNLNLTDTIQQHVQVEETPSKRFQATSTSSTPQETQPTLTPQQYIEDANRYRRDRNVKKVNEIMTQALAVYPDNEDLLCYYAEYIYLGGEFEKALKLLEKAPQSERCSTLKTRIEKTRQDPQGKYQQRQQLPTQSRKKQDPFQLVSLDNPHLSPFQTSTTATARRTQPPQEFMQEIEKYVLARQFVEAKASINQALSLYPRDISLVNFCTNALFLIGYPIEECLKVLRTIFHSSASTSTTTTTEQQQVQNEQNAEPNIPVSLYLPLENLPPIHHPLLPTTSTPSSQSLTPIYFLQQIKDLQSSQYETRHCQPFIEQTLRIYPKDSLIAYEAALFFYMRKEWHQALLIINTILLNVPYAPNKPQLQELRLTIVNQLLRSNLPEKATEQDIAPA